ncbi:MAG: sugar ABC transporter substrate-binding protein [Paraburkholderia sp.]|jgi:ribose transport system substrate-binding protein
MKNSRNAMTLAFCVCASVAHADNESIALFTKNQTNPYFQSIRLGAQNAAKEMHVSLTNYVPTQADSIPEQMSQIDDVIVKRPSAVVFVPVDFKAMGPGIAKLNAAKIPAVNVADRAQTGDFVSFVGASDYQLGLQTARYLLKSLGGKGNVIILEGVRGTSTSEERMRGFHDALKEAPAVKVLSSQPGNYQRMLALQVTENLLQTYPRVDGILAANDAMAIGALDALDGANRKAKVVGINASKEAVDLIKQGKLLASGDYSGFKQGCLGVMAAVRALHKQPVPKDISLKTEVVTSANYQSFDVAPEKMTCPAWADAVGQ